MFLCLQANMSVPFTITILHCLTCCPGPTLTQLRVNIVEVHIDVFMTLCLFTISQCLTQLQSSTHIHLQRNQMTAIGVLLNC